MQGEDMIELVNRPGVFAKTVENSAIGAVNWYLKRRLWRLIRVRHQRRRRNFDNNGVPHYTATRHRIPRHHGFRRTKKVINPDHALDFLGTVLKVAQKYPIQSNIWHSCRGLVKAILENKDYMLTVQATPNELASHLFAVMGIIDAHIDTRKQLAPPRFPRSGRVRQGRRRRNRHKEGRYIERMNEEPNNGMDMYNFLVGDD